MEVFAVAEKLLSVFFVPYVDWVSAEEVEEFGEDFGGAVGDFGGEDGGWTEETLAGETGEDFVGGREKDGEAEGEVVWGVAGGVEEVAVDLEGAGTDGYEDFGFEELGN